MSKLTIALAGNPNCGKTTLFNALTGSKQRVGNWPGVTVEHKEGEYEHDNCQIKVIDLPGIYSFSAYSLDEKVSREFILNEKPDLVVNIVDATNLERNLYLTTQLLEMKIPVIILLNMMDIAKQRKIHIETKHLAEHLGCPVIPIVASKKIGLNDVKNAINEAGQKKHISKTQVLYDSVVENALNSICQETKLMAEVHKVDNRWLAIKLLEMDEIASEITENTFEKLIEKETVKIEKHIGDDIDIIVADGRYGFIHGLSRDVVHRHDQIRKTVSDNIDKVVLNRFLGIPIFFAVMYFVFMITINLGGAFIDFFDIFTGTIFVDGLGTLFGNLHFPEWLSTFLAGGIGGGIQTVATFIPPIFFMFLSLSILEDSGYMSRAAFVMDRFMRFIGLPGKAFIPMLVGFGCNVPAIMATRTLENNRDRILTILINPFMSCGARLPVYVLFATVFFPKNGGLIVFAIYMMGILLAIFSGLLFKRTILKGETSTFVMELPPYHIPTFNGIMMHTWQRLKSFLIRAGKVIIVVVIILSFLNAIGNDGSFGNEDSENSLLSSIGKSITPIFKPMGIQESNWPATVGLFTGIFAKEAVVGTLDNLYTSLDKSPKIEEKEKFDFWTGIVESFQSIGDGLAGIGETFKDPLGITVEDNLENLNTQADEQKVNIGTFKEMKTRFGSKSAAFAYLLFILIYMPCVAAIAAVYRETNLKWAIFSVLYLTILAWIISTLFYQASMFAIQPAISTMWIFGLVIISIATYLVMKIKSKNIEISA
ncbi:MAG: Fe(2+) transporter permease subunit FeoB [Candidatus Cloacimonetes bacterium]|jgi:ferrous iron transport protein B|nr:Fe(2+) transporter permease subunit FeoB [Candidatus Cloacimonadota bacterium]MBT7470336.1 Fe(2+) transporter permease subunit FeoB [Candidatus Cloacimonadota bacterium]